MSGPPPLDRPGRRPGPCLGVRLILFLAAATLAGFLLRGVALRLHQRPDPAGFGRGVVHGAFMPLTLPTLLVGHDVPIYAPVNTGRPYKIGYIVGVNLCGLAFFGLLFQRIRAWRSPT